MDSIIGIVALVSALLGITAPRVELRPATVWAEADPAAHAIYLKAGAEEWSGEALALNLAHEAYHLADAQDDGLLNGSVAVPAIAHEPRANAYLLTGSRTYQEMTPDQLASEYQANRYACGLSPVGLWCDAAEGDAK